MLPKVCLSHEMGRIVWAQFDKAKAAFRLLTKSQPLIVNLFVCAQTATLPPGSLQPIVYAALSWYPLKFHVGCFDNPAGNFIRRKPRPLNLVNHVTARSKAELIVAPVAKAAHG
jgi:hypothetical protein